MSITIRRLSIAALSIAVLMPSWVAAQSLGELAQQEKDRRKNAKKPAKTFTEEDLKSAGGRTANVMDANGSGSDAAPADATAPASDAAKPGAKEKTAEEKRADAEKAWRDQLTKARDKVTQLQTALERLQAVANDQNAMQFGTARADMLNRLEDTKNQLAAAQQAVTDLEDQGRRSGWRG